MAKGDITEHIATLEHHVNTNFFEIQRRFDELLKFQDRTKVNFLEVERKLVEYDQKYGVLAKPGGVPSEEFSSLESRLVDKIKSLEDIVMLLELEVAKAKEQPSISELGITPKLPSAFEDRLKVLEQKFTTLEKLKLNVPVELIQHEPRLKSMEENIRLNKQKLSEEISRIENMVAGRAVTEQSAQRFIEKMREEMSELRRDIDKAELIKAEIAMKEKSFATRQELERFEIRAKDEIEHIHALTDRIASAERSIDSKLVDIEDTVRSEAEEHRRSSDNKMLDVESKLTSEFDSHRRSFDTKIADLESKLMTEFDSHRRNYDTKIVDMEERAAKTAAEVASTEIRKDVEKAIAIHRSELGPMMQRMNTIERDLESRATAVVSKEIASFSEAIDRKFPDLMTKNDFATWSRAVAQRVQTIEAPDVRPMMDRMDKFELRLNELSELIREVATRMPIVVE